MKKLKIYLKNLKTFKWELHQGTIKSLQKEFNKRNIKVCLEANLKMDIKLGNMASVGYRASVGNRASVGEGASVGDLASVGYRASVGDWASVGYRASVVKNAKLNKSMKADIIQYIAKTLNIYPIKNKYILYKRVNKISERKYASCYDSNFIYEDGKIVTVKNPDNNINNSCSSGIHVSTPFYWTQGNTLIACEVNVKDIITCLENKIRCKKVKVIGEIKE